MDRSRVLQGNKRCAIGMMPMPIRPMLRVPTNCPRCGRGAAAYRAGPHRVSSGYLPMAQRSGSASTDLRMGRQWASSCSCTAATGCASTNRLDRSCGRRATPWLGGRTARAIRWRRPPVSRTSPLNLPLRSPRPRRRSEVRSGSQAIPQAAIGHAHAVRRQSA